MESTVSPQIGKKLSRDIHPSLLENDSLAYLVNGDIQDYTHEQNGIFVQNLPGNKACVDLLDNFLGSIALDKDQFLLFNAPGLIRLVTGCHVKEVTNSPCLNLSGKVQGRYHYVGSERHIYFIEEGGPIRTLNLDCLPRKKEGDCDSCDPQYTDEFDCEQTLYNPKVDYPCVEIDAREGGSVPNGSYQLAIAFYEDDQRVTDYFIYPNVIKPFNNLGGNFTITGQMDSCLSSLFDSYEVVLITNRVDRGTLAQSVGRYDTSQGYFSISELDNERYTPIDLQVLLSTNVRYQSAGFIANNNESLVLAGVEARKKLNGQLVANEIISKWQTISVRPEDAHLYPSFNRWEVYAFDIAWVFCDGEESRRFHIPNNVPRPAGSLPQDENYWEHEGCVIGRLDFWHLNDSSTLDFYNPMEPDCKEPRVVAEGDFSYWESENNLYDDSFGDLACEKIKYHRFPKHCTHGEATMLHTNSPCAEPNIHIMGVKFDNIATPDYCDGRPGSDVIGYKIYVRERKGQESVLSSGLVYNTRYETLPNGEQSMFQNFPFNELPNNNRPDQYLVKDKVNQGNIFDPLDSLTEYHQDRFTYHSPDLQYIKGARGTEIEAMFEAIGNIKGEFHETSQMPKYQVLSPLGRLAAQTAGILEAKEVLEGQPCTRVVTERECHKKVPRQTDVMDFPIPDVSRDGYTLVNGTATPGVPAIQTGVRTENYSYITAGDEDCTTEYTLSSVEVIPYFNPLGELSNSPDTCRLEVITDAPKGTILTVTLNGNEYNIALDDNGRGTIQLFNDCVPNNTDPPLENEWTENNVQHSFSRDCECTGDTVTTERIETETCDTKIKFLSNLPYHERLPAMLFYYSQGRQAVGDILQSLITPTNYAIQYTATSTVSSWACTPGLKRRRVDFQQFITPSKVFVNEKRFNNRYQSSADYLEIHSPLPDPINTDLSRVLHSEMGCQKEFSCATLGGDPVQSVNHYTQLRRRLPDQYGQVNDGQVRSISCVLNLVSTPTLFGGDVYISKHRFVRKFQLFDSLPLGLPNNTEFDLSAYPHIAFPRFWMDNNKESIIEDIVEDLPLVTGLFQDYNLDSVSALGQCFGPLDLQNWTGLLGGPGYLIQWINSIVNDGWSNPFKLSGRYYTHVTGVVEYWGESRFIANNRENNELPETQYHINDQREIAESTRYNNPEVFLYNLQYLWEGVTRQTLHASTQECCEPNNNLVYSLTQQSTDRRDKWRQLLPNNYSPLPTHTGKLTVVKEIDQYNLFLGFEDAVWVTQQDDGLLTNNLNEVFLGTGSAFSRRLRRVSDDTTGYGGIQDPNSVCVTRYGTFWVDRKRRKFLMYNGQLNDYTNNMQSWFNCWLDDKVDAVYDIFSDNIYLSIGDKGLVFKPKLQDFVSFLDWGVDSFTQLNYNFLSQKDGKLWLHNQQDYQSFFGEQRRFEVGIILKDRLRQNILQSVDIYAEFLKISNKDQYYVDEFFDEVMAFNQKYTTTWLPITLKNPNNTLRGISRDMSFVSQVEDFTYRMNNLDIRSTLQPIIRNIDGVDYTTGERNIEENKPIRGKYIELRLKKRSNTKVRLQLGMGLNQIQTTP